MAEALGRPGRACRAAGRTAARSPALPRASRWPRPSAAGSGLRRPTGPARSRRSPPLRCSPGCSRRRTARCRSPTSARCRRRRCAGRGSSPLVPVLAMSAATRSMTGCHRVARAGSFRGEQARGVEEVPVVEVVVVVLVRAEGRGLPDHALALRVVDEAEGRALRAALRVGPLVELLDERRLDRASRRPRPRAGWPAGRAARTGGAPCRRSRCRPGTAWCRPRPCAPGRPASPGRRHSACRGPAGW